MGNLEGLDFVPYEKISSICECLIVCLARGLGAIDFGFV